jgi:hypothetical protein
MLASNGPGDTETKTNARLGRIARRIAPVEWRENLLLLIRRNAWPIVVDDNGDAVAIAHDVDASAFPIFDGIIDEICDSSADIGWPTRNIDAAPTGIGDLTARIAGIFANISNEDTDIHQPSRFPTSVIARESQRRIDHGIHVFQIIDHLALLLTVRD